MSAVVPAPALRAGDRIMVAVPPRSGLSLAIYRQARRRPREIEARVTAIGHGPHGSSARCQAAGIPGVDFDLSFSPLDLVERSARAGWAA